MGIFDSLKPWYGRKAVRGLAFLAVVAVAAAFLLGRDEVVEVAVSEPTKPLVELTTAEQYQGGESLSLVGDVRSFTEAAITSERAGRVTGVNVTLGQSVQAGQILVTLENASEQAAVLQAEGVYEAALASAAQSGVGVDEAQASVQSAKTRAVNVVRSSYTTNDSIIRNNIDTFFSQPNSPLPGLNIGTVGNRDFLTSERVAYQTLLPAWKAQTDSLTAESDLIPVIDSSIANTERTLAILNTFLAVFDQRDDADFQAVESEFLNLRPVLLGQISELEAAKRQIESAENNLRSAQLAAAGTTNSAADAQAKQALGALRAAQANLAKTILRSPISGTVNSIDVRPGDFINSFTQVAEVANNNALEIVTFVGDKERSVLSIGDEVDIEGGFTGRVTQIAPAVDPRTRKTEVRIAAEGIDLKNGDTVIVSKDITAATSTDVIVPLSAVKFQLEDGVIFLVEDGRLVSRTVTLGIVRGGSVAVVDGLTATERFVVDARGLQPGTEVEIAN